MTLAKTLIVAAMFPFIGVAAAEPIKDPDARLILDVDRLAEGGALAMVEWMTAESETHLAMNGYDPVSYFHEGVPELGDPQYEAAFHGATFRFASEDHYRMFLADPEHFAPAFGGYDVEALVAGAFRAADPLDWAIVEDRLVLGLHRPKPRTSRADEPEMIRLAEEKWRAVDDHYRSIFFQAHGRDFRDCGQGGCVEAPRE